MPSGSDGPFSTRGVGMDAKHASFASRPADHAMTTFYVLEAPVRSNLPDVTVLVPVEELAPSVAVHRPAVNAPHGVIAAGPLLLDAVEAGDEELAATREQRNLRRRRRRRRQWRRSRRHIAATPSSTERISIAGWRRLPASGSAHDVAKWAQLSPSGDPRVATAPASDVDPSADAARGARRARARHTEIML